LLVLFERERLAQLTGALYHHHTGCPMSQHDPVETLWNTRKSYIFLAALAFVFFQAGLLAGHWSTVPTDSTTSLQLAPPPTRLTGNVAEHPIPRLMANAERRFRTLLSRQSHSLRGAVAEYKRRYGRNPPKGFDAWWRFVQENKMKIVDEYDGLVSDLEPFWEMTGAEFRLKAFQVCATMCCGQYDRCSSYDAFSRC